MKTTAKQEMMNVVERYAKKNGEVYEVSKEDFEKLAAEVEAIEKFVIVSNKKDETLKAVAYKTKKSERLAVLKVVETVETKETKEVKKHVKVRTEMQKDNGMSVHSAYVTIVKDESFVKTNDYFERLVELVNEKIEEAALGFLAKAKMEGVVEDGRSCYGYIVFDKIKGHSKDGYAAYKKALSAARREFEKVA